ncbi:hypothetical protein [Colwellia sp. Bg11-12]|jgi:hypothetical protein|uniref:hypothetical protein n=1 Tax=Colwellia sp. Bg11-12 TaxID=2759817 RepID=UPI0015F59670|nr:hypothetical protein [Colwellia sp. Bg11-12]MBA6262143.1 hypothetical protein [Colwellia sp. Bg11-12]
MLNSIPIEWYAFGPLILFASNGLIHLLFGVAVYFDARSQDKYPPTGSIFVKPIIWGIATLVGGVFVAAVYWLMHHSTLRKV